MAKRKLGGKKGKKDNLVKSEKTTKSLKTDSLKPKEQKQNKSELDLKNDINSDETNPANIIENHVESSHKKILYSIVFLLIVFSIIIFYYNYKKNMNLKAAEKNTYTTTDAEYQELINYYPKTKASNIAEYMLLGNHISQNSKNVDQELDDFISNKNNNIMYSNALFIKGSKILKNAKDNKKEINKAIEYFKEIHEISKKEIVPTKMLTYIRWSEALMRINKIDEAKKLLSDAAKNNIGSPFMDMIDESLLEIENKKIKEDYIDNSRSIDIIKAPKNELNKTIKKSIIKNNSKKRNLLPKKNNKKGVQLYKSNEEIQIIDN